MSSDLKRNFLRELIASRWTLILLGGSSGATSAMAFATYLEPQGWGYLGYVFALSGGVCLWAFFVTFWGWGVNVVAHYPPPLRRKAMPEFVCGLAVLVCVSSISGMETFLGGTARELYRSDYAQELARISDKGNEAALTLNQIAALLTDEVEGTLKPMEKGERLRGELSGYPSMGNGGQIVGLLNRLIATFKQTAKSATKGAADATKLNVRITESLGRLRAAQKGQRVDSTGRVTASSLSKKEVETLFANAADPMRLLILDLKESLPVASLEALAAALGAETTIPTFAKDQKVAAGQRAALAKIDIELKRINRVLRDKIARILVLVNVETPIYKHLTLAQMVARYWHASPNAISLPLGLDLLPLIIFFYVCRYNDNTRDQQKALADVDDLTVGEIRASLAALNQLLGEARQRQIEGPHFEPSSLSPKKPNGQAEQPDAALEEELVR